jgi:septal ring factor EnvC (AmiA/AmiB activator)
MTVKSRWAFDYEIAAPDDEDREIVIDEARPDGWRPADGTKDIEETATRLRYKVTAPKGQTTKAALGLERLDTQIVVLATLEPDDLLAAVKGLENETPAFRDAVAKLSAVVADINRAEQQRSDLEEERTKIGEDQERIRKNLQSTGQGSDLGRRYLDMLRKQEDRLTAMAEADKGLLAEIASKRKTATDMARALTL